MVDGLCDSGKEQKMSEGKKRRERLMSALEQADRPVSGTELAKRFGVSRQVIVQDIAILRAENQPVLSTYKGYILQKQGPGAESSIRVFCLAHSTEDTLDELCTIVDYGGTVLDVSVEHQLYGWLRGDLVIRNRLDAMEFTERLKQCPDQPMKSLTGGCHYHTVSAPSDKHLDMIETALNQKGYLMIPEAKGQKN